jgi:hypothetical protein
MAAKGQQTMVDALQKGSKKKRKNRLFENKKLDAKK